MEKQLLKSIVENRLQ